MKLSFRVKIIIGIAVIELVMFSVLIGNDLNILVNSHREIMEDTIKTTLIGFKSSTVNAIAAVDTATLDELSSGLVATPMVSYVVIENMDQVELSKASDDDVSLARVRNVHRSLDSVENDIYRTKINVDTSSGNIGRIFIGFDVQKLQKTKKESVKQALTIAVMGLVLSALFSYLFGTMLSRRIKILQQAAERISAADYTTKINSMGSDELSHIGAVFDSMMTTLEEQESTTRKYQTELEELNRELDNKVKRRTHALTKTNKELEGAIQKLEEAQIQLVQSEKMASIGQLAAGVAHEISNPVGYVSSNIASLKSYLKNIFKLINVYKHMESKVNDRDLVLAVNKLKTDIDFEYMAKDILDLLSESEEGVRRVTNIVQDLKEYSHVDRANWHATDIHKGLDSTLNIAKNEIKYKAEIIKEYGDIPLVECFSSQINQVFMNLIVNAVQAIQNQGVITIRTWHKGDSVCVEFTDTGSGIEDHNLNRIFDPFFTTKPVGVGMGLGLSLSYNIIKKHQGRMEVSSKFGSGTSFFVWIPVKHQHSKKNPSL